MFYGHVISAFIVTVVGMLKDGPFFLEQSTNLNVYILVLALQ